MVSLFSSLSRVLSFSLSISISLSLSFSLSLFLLLSPSPARRYVSLSISFSVSRSPFLSLPFFSLARSLFPPVIYLISPPSLPPTLSFSSPTRLWWTSALKSDVCDIRLNFDGQRIGSKFCCDTLVQYELSSSFSRSLSFRCRLCVCVSLSSLQLLVVSFIV